ncbi:MAG: MFS transporter [Candidatus Blackburnbacteria bacterium]|nr:MFS transporter [Candidatus Blackburnbacteria bacterium]
MKRVFDSSLGVLLVKSDFPKLWASQILNQVGINLLNFVLVLRIFERTHSSFAVSLVWLFYALPAIILGPFSGTITDLFSRRKVLIITNIAQASIILVYLFIKTSVWPIYAVIFIYALFNQLFIPAEAATLPVLVKKKLLPLANSLFLFTIYASILAGYGLAGPLLGLVGAKTPFIVVAGMIILAALSVSLLPKDARKHEVSSPAQFWALFQEGYEFIKRKPAVLLPLLLLVLIGIVVPVLGILSPAIATDILGIRLLDVSTRLIVPIGLGAILGAFLAIKFLRNNRKKRVIGIGMLTAGISVFLLGVILPNLPNRSFLGSVIGFFLGISLAASVVPAQTMLQENTPDNFRGRVFGILNFAIVIASFIPVLSIAALTELLGEKTILVFLAAVFFAAALATFNFEYILRRLYAKTV